MHVIHTALQRYELMADAGRRNALRRIVLYLPGKVAAAEAPALAGVGENAVAM